MTYSYLSHKEKISVIIPHWDSVPGAPEALRRCVASLRGCDELIIVSNEGTGFAHNVNIGLASATGTHLCVVNNDTEMIAGNLGFLAYFDYAVTVPKILPEPRDHMPRAFFCMPRWVYEKIGPYDERFQMGYFEDDDFIKRLEQDNIPVKYVPNDIIVQHQNGGGLSMKFAGEQENFDRNKKIFDEKWGLNERKMG